MKAVEIVCASCGVTMRLSSMLLERIEGHAGRVTCRRCGNKIHLDARLGLLAIVEGGELVTEASPERAIKVEPVSMGATEAVQLHFSEFPLGATEAPPAAEVAPAPPQLNQVADDSLIQVPDNFKSAPMSNNLRDQTFQSLYPAASGSASIDSVVASAISPSPLGEMLPLTVEPPPNAAGQELERGQGRSQLIPWLIAAAACAALALNLTRGAGEAKTPPTSVTSVAEIQASQTPPKAAIPGGVVVASPGVSPAAAADPSEGAPPATQVVALPATQVVEAVALPTKRKTEQASKSVTGATSTTATPTAATPTTQESPASIPFSASAAAQAIRQAATVASRCRKPGDPSGVALVQLTFASSGKVTAATVSGPPFAGTATGSCIAEQMRTARVPAFTGNRVSLSRTVTIQ